MHRAVEYYVSVYGWILSCCIVLAPAIGFLVERIGVAASFAVEHGLCIAWILCLLTNEERMQIPAFILFGTTRALYFSLFFMFIFRMWGPKLFGSHLSMMMGAVGLISLVQYPMLKYVEEEQQGNWIRPTQWQLVTALASSIFPIYMLLNRKKYKIMV